MALITAQQVITLSFTHLNTDTSLVKAAYITIAELEYIKPRLGEDLYNVIAAGSLSGKNQILYETYITPAMAFYVKYLCLPDLYIKTASAGLQINNREFSNSGGKDDRADLGIATLNMAEMFMGNAIKYIEHPDNIEYFTTYTTSDETKVKVRSIGGILFE